MLNLHPYNPGHLMVVPYRHVSRRWRTLTPRGDAGADAIHPRAVVAIQAVRPRTASTSGSTWGDVAGGSLADHLHQHVVPRWGGDANFITVLAQTKVIPELLADTRDMIAAAWSTADDDEVDDRVRGDSHG